MKKGILTAALLAGGVYALMRARRRRYSPDELRNLFWDEENRRWRTDEEVRDILERNPERVPEPLSSEEARVLSYLTEIEANAHRNLIEPSLICAVISRESAGDWSARGPVGEYGLMQVRATTAQMLGYRGDPDDLFNPSVNVRYGAEYLRWQMDRYDDRVDWAVAAYNRGTAKMKRGRFTNQEYVDSVVKYRWPRYAYLVNRIHGIYGPRPQLGGMCIC